MKKLCTSNNFSGWKIFWESRSSVNARAVQYVSVPKVSYCRFIIIHWIPIFVGFVDTGKP